jgi:hypothetical protein
MLSPVAAIPIGKLPIPYAALLIDRAFAARFTPMRIRSRSPIVPHPPAVPQGDLPGGVVRSFSGSGPGATAQIPVAYAGIARRVLRELRKALRTLPGKPP